MVGGWLVEMDELELVYGMILSGSVIFGLIDCEVKLAFGLV